MRVLFICSVFLFIFSGCGPEPITKISHDIERYEEIIKMLELRLAESKSLDNDISALRKDILLKEEKKRKLLEEHPELQEKVNGTKF